ncbi:MFS transporter [Paenibacillus harenae]|uniref:MFS family permease n=1 Tax=Paenibacillus harenae TaxID=306543 RepID=A0ABT9TYS9_PAEHA|nr:MFS transporter [Paenibacillus harenae]MDQ0060439.1 MFS family permease [Paenibacillus harenae]MDQ0112046.1 MFS family permease [Paenibacillus harenae]
MSANAAAAPAGGLLRNKFYQTIILSNVLLQIGIWVRNFAILFYVTDQTNNDPSAVGLIGFVEFLPIFVFSFIGGTFADKWKPRLTMIWCDFLSALSVFVVLITLLYGTWHMVYFATFVSAILSQFSQPSAMKLFKQHIAPEQLQQAMAMFQTLVAIFMVLGPSLGVITYQNFGIEVSIGVMGVAFLLSALVLYRIPRDQEIVKSESEASSKIWSDMKAGMKYVWRSPVLKSLGGTFALAGIAVGIAQTLGLYVVIERLGQTKDFLQFMLMINGIAMLIGGGAVMVLAKKISPQKLLAIGILLSSLCMIGMGISTSVPLTLGLQFMNGLGFPCIQIGISTMILQWSEESYVGRVNGVLSPMFMGTMVLMTLVAGELKEVFPLVGIYSVAGTLMFLGMLLLVPLFKHKPLQVLTDNSK